ncbi:MAG: DUF3788 family protein [Methanobacterium sp.]
MNIRPFSDKETEPTEEKLKQTLGVSYVYYNELIEIADSFLKDWNFSKGSGWMLKVHDKKKALFYLIPFNDKFKISMAIRENERKAFLEDDELEKIHNLIKSSKEYREGYALRFDVRNADDFGIIELLIKKLIARRI